MRRTSLGDLLQLAWRINAAVRDNSRKVLESEEVKREYENVSSSVALWRRARAASECNL